MTDPRPGAIFQIGDLLNNTYRIEAVLGRGGTSEVYQARSEISGHRVALKALRSEFSENEGFINLMKREEDIREIRHDAIVRYFHNQRTADGVVFLVMDYVEGPGLDQKMKDGGMSAADLLTIAECVTEGLETAHSKNIVHRDLSPDNIILRNGDAADAVIIDFGIAKDSNPGAETVVGNEFAGKYAYAAPEQLSGNSDARSDIYSLGALLLATFRGASPSAGMNPLEVIEAKSEPLNTTGVSEPLGGIINRMTNPDPEKRFQSASDLLAAIRGGGNATEPLNVSDDEDATVITPRPTPAKVAPESRSSKSSGEPGKGRGGMVALLMVFLAVAIGSGAYLTGALDDIFSLLPRAEPFTLLVQKSGGMTPQAEGFVPSEEMSAALSERMSAQSGTANLTLARGAIDAAWPNELLSLVDLLTPLPEWRIDASDNALTVTGMTEDRTEQQILNGMTLPVPFTGAVEIELGPRTLQPDRVEAILDTFGDCGALRLVSPPVSGYPNGAEVVVSGKVASEGTRAILADAILTISGNRNVRVETEVLNPTLCLIDQVLPNSPPGDFIVGFGDGDTGASNQAGQFVVGQNPVIDITIPAAVSDGYLYVTALDVSGNVFHMLPNVYIEDNSIAALRDGQNGPVMLRVAHSLAEAEAAGGNRLAFQVDDTALGKTEIVVIHADLPILNGTRPITESAEGFAQALVERSGPVRSLDTRILETTVP